MHMHVVYIFFGSRLYEPSGTAAAAATAIYQALVIIPLWRRRSILIITFIAPSDGSSFGYRKKGCSKLTMYVAKVHKIVALLTQFFGAILSFLYPEFNFLAISPIY